MASNKDNTIFEQTSFLQGGNSPFIKELYLKYLKDPETVPQSWIKFFDGLDEDQEVIKKEILGPSWNPSKNKNIENNFFKKDLKKSNDLISNGATITQESLEKEKEESVKAIALIRAYRIRGHLIANLDPLEMMERKYLHELHPADHGF